MWEKNRRGGARRFLIWDDGFRRMLWSGDGQEGGRMSLDWVWTEKEDLLTFLDFGIFHCCHLEIFILRS